MSNLLKRIVPVILVLSICITCLVSPVSASNFETEDLLYDYFSYSTSSPYHTVYPDRNTVTFDLPQRQYIRYVDLVIGSGQTINGVSCKRGSNITSLTMLPIGNGYYRLYGALGGGKAAWGDTISFIFDVTSSGADIQFIKFNYSIMAIDYWPETLGIYAQPTSLSGITYMSDPDTPLSVDFRAASSYPTDYYGWIYLSDWKKYDYMDLLIQVDSAGLSSLSCNIGDKAVPFSVTLYDSDFGQIDYVEVWFDEITQSNMFLFTYGVSYQWIQIHVDLTDVRRSVSDTVTIDFTGNLAANRSQRITLSSCCGYVLPSNQNELTVLFGSIKDTIAYWFQGLYDKFDQAFGLNDNSASAAQQTQEEINVSINNQLVGAVEDWNTNIEVVETGYDMAFSKTTPSLTWLSSLADGIFNGMGWFGNVYFLVGLISVIMLVLSKSGLAHKIGNLSRRKGD